MKLANLLMERRVTMNLRARTKDEAVVELLELITAEGISLDPDAILESIREREEMENTSYGRGFAFPHARTDAVKEMYILIGVSAILPVLFLFLGRLGGVLWTRVFGWLIRRL